MGQFKNLNMECRLDNNIASVLNFIILRIILKQYKKIFLLLGSPHIVYY